MNTARLVGIIVVATLVILGMTMLSIYEEGDEHKRCSPSVRIMEQDQVYRPKYYTLEMFDPRDSDWVVIERATNPNQFDEICHTKEKYETPY